MAKSLRSKRKKRLRTLRREIVEPFYEKEDTKLKAQEAALNSPKLPVRMPKNHNADSMDLVEAPPSSNSMDVEMADGGSEHSRSLLKPVGGHRQEEVEEEIADEERQVTRERGYMGAKLTKNIECEIFQVLLEEAKASYRDDIVVALQSNTVEDVSRNVTLMTEWVNNWRPSRSS